MYAAEGPQKMIAQVEFRFCFAVHERSRARRYGSRWFFQGRTRCFLTTSGDHARVATSTFLATFCVCLTRRCRRTCSSSSRARTACGRTRSCCPMAEYAIASMTETYPLRISSADYAIEMLCTNFVPTFTHLAASAESMSFIGGTRRDSHSHFPRECCQPTMGLSRI